MNSKGRLANVVGRADMCELLGKCFSFPDRDVAEALSDGRIISDLVFCCADCGAAQAADPRFAGGLHSFVGRNATELLKEMRREYSILFLGPGLGVSVFPYESAYLHVLQGRQSAPVLFRSALTLDVERQMRSVGAISFDARKEPCDSVHREFEFLSYLYGNLAGAIQREDSEAERLLRARTERFLEDHALRWMPSLMEGVAILSDGAYGLFAWVALAFLETLGQRDGSIAFDGIARYGI